MEHHLGRMQLQGLMAAFAVDPRGRDWLVTGTRRGALGLWDMRFQVCSALSSVVLLWAGVAWRACACCLCAAMSLQCFADPAGPGLGLCIQPAYCFIPEQLY